jgi:hypothetical protein
MRHGLRCALLLPASLVLGCGTITPAPPITAKGTTIGPHGGSAVPLPDDKGYAEVVVERESRAIKSARSRIAVYFLTSDLKSPFGGAPSGVIVKAVPPEGEAVTLTLAPAPASSDKAGKCRFVSDPGKFDYDELRGELTATIDGKSMTQPFAFH